MLGSLGVQEWERVGMHAERGPGTVRTMFHMAAGHDLVHLRQITRIIRAIQA
jgi:hypothetical protein